MIPQLLAKHKREKKRDEDGAAVEGEFVDLFDVEHFEKDGKTKNTKPFPLEKAVEVFSANPDNAHYRQDTKIGGSGGSGFLRNFSNVDPKDMTSHDKIVDGFSKRDFSPGNLNLEATINDTG